jgi:uncharacterized protein (TIGR02145 family)
VSNQALSAESINTITLTVTAENGTIRRSTITVVVCGNIVDGLGVTGCNGTYRTKIYGGVEWMIDNSKETCNVSGCDYDPIDRAAYGYLYSWNCAASACPSDWVFPNDADFAGLGAVLTHRSGGSDWNIGYSLAGFGIQGRDPGYQGSIGIWWSSRSSYRMWRVDSGDTSGKFGVYTYAYSCSVRCRKP